MSENNGVTGNGGRKAGRRMFDAAPLSTLTGGCDLNIRHDLLSSRRVAYAGTRFVAALIDISNEERRALKRAAIACAWLEKSAHLRKT